MDNLGLAFYRLGGACQNCSQVTVTIYKEGIISHGTI